MSFRLRLHSCLRQSGGAFGAAFNVQAKAWTYLSWYGNGNGNGNGKSNSNSNGDGDGNGNSRSSACGEG
jgi:hypothetical protein